MGNFIFGPTVEEGDCPTCGDSLTYHLSPCPTISKDDNEKKKKKKRKNKRKKKRKKKKR